MATLTQIRQDIATRLAALNGVTAYAIVLDSIEPPCFVVGMPETVEYNLAFGPTAATWRIPVRLFVSRFDVEVAQDALDAYIAATGTDSAKAAVENTAVSITSAWHSVTVLGVSGFGAYRVGDIEYLGCEFTVEVVAA